MQATSDERETPLAHGADHGSRGPARPRPPRPADDRRRALRRRRADSQRARGAHCADGERDELPPARARALGHRRACRPARGWTRAALARGRTLALGGLGQLRVVRRRGRRDRRRLPPAVPRGAPPLVARRGCGERGVARGHGHEPLVALADGVRARGLHVRAESPDGELRGRSEQRRASGRGAAYRLPLRNRPGGGEDRGLVARWLGVALVVGDSAHEATALHGDVVLARLVVLVGDVALALAHVSLLIGELELVLAPPRGDLAKEAHAETVPNLRANGLLADAMRQTAFRSVGTAVSTGPAPRF